MNEHARGSRSALFTLALMIGMSALAGCKGGGGGSEGDGAVTPESSVPNASDSNSSTDSPGSSSGTNDSSSTPGTDDSGSNPGANVPAPNSAPTITGTAATSVAINATYSFIPNARDVDGDIVTFQITNKPAWATFNTVTGELRGQPKQAGTFADIQITASDGKTSTSLPGFTIAVLAPAPTVGSVTLSWTAPTENVDGSPLTNLAGFVIAYGKTSTTLSQTVRVDNPSVDSHLFDALPSGTYYFGIRALNSDGAESEMSRVVSKTIT
jgi:hypothetical protein